MVEGVNVDMDYLKIIGWGLFVMIFAGICWYITRPGVPVDVKEIKEDLEDDGGFNV